MCSKHLLHRSRPIPARTPTPTPQSPRPPPWLPVASTPICFSIHCAAARHPLSWPGHSPPPSNSDGSPSCIMPPLLLPSRGGPSSPSPSQHGATHSSLAPTVSPHPMQLTPRHVFSPLSPECPLSPTFLVSTTTHRGAGRVSCSWALPWLPSPPLSEDLSAPRLRTPHSDPLLSSPGSAVL